MPDEWLKIALASAVTGPATWPLAARLISLQNDPKSSYRFLSHLSLHGVRTAMRGVTPYAAYKVFGIGVQRGVQAPVISILLEQQQQQRHQQFPGLSLSVNDATRPSVSLGAVSIYALSGVASGIVGGVLVTPLEQFKISNANRDFSSASATRAFFLQRGLPGLTALFSGTKITVFRNVLFDSVNSVLYNVSVSAFKVDKHDVLSMSFVNAFAGVTTAIVDYPLDVLKTRIQSRTAERFAAEQGKGPSPLSQGIVEVARNMVREEGVLSLYGGLKHKLVLYFAVWGVYGGAYALVGRLLQRR